MIDDVLREVPTTAVATEPVAESEPVVSESIEPTFPDSRQPAQPAANSEPEDDTFRFASLEAKKMDDKVGQVLDLEEDES